MSWAQLISILSEAKQFAEDDRALAPQACPNDGEPLREAPDGGLFCVYDGFRWPS